MVLMCDFNTFSGLVLCCKSVRMSQITNDLQNWERSKKIRFRSMELFRSIGIFEVFGPHYFRDDGQAF